MAMYTFYLWLKGGSSSGLEVLELGSDAAARDRALKLLSDHPSCAYVAVWDDDRPVLTHPRAA